MIRLSARFLADDSSHCHNVAAASILHRFRHFSTRVRRLLRIALRRAAHRHEHGLTPVEWHAGSKPFRTPDSAAGASRRHIKC